MSVSYVLVDCRRPEPIDNALLPPMVLVLPHVSSCAGGLSQLFKPLNISARPQSRLSIRSSTTV
jgi:hypothetical protein